MKRLEILYMLSLDITHIAFGVGIFWQANTAKLVFVWDKRKTEFLHKKGSSRIQHWELARP